jgi:hypothetical protein
MGKKGEDSLAGISRLMAAYAVDAIPVSASVAVGRFAERLVISPWSSREAASQQILALKYQPPKGATALFSALDDAIQQFANYQFGDTVFLVTDGGENHSKIEKHRLLQDLTLRGIRVFVFLVLVHEPKSADEFNDIHEMEYLAQQTGGLFFRLPWTQEWVKSGEAAAVVKNIRFAAGSPYRVEIPLKTPLTKPAKLKLETSLDPKRYTVAYPRRLGPCTAAPQP